MKNMSHLGYTGDTQTERLAQHVVCVDAKCSGEGLLKTLTGNEFGHPELKDSVLTINYQRYFDIFE